MRGIPAYKENSVVTQSPGQLVVLLYEGAVKALRQAIAAMDSGDTEERGKQFGKATDIINELNCVLDMDAGGEFVTNLRRLYEFMTRHLIEANVKSDSQMVRDVIKLLEDLNEGWKAIAD